jgi:hypothetical protein
MKVRHSIVSDGTADRFDAGWSGACMRALNGTSSDIGFFIHDQKRCQSIHVQFDDQAEALRFIHVLLGTLLPIPPDRVQGVVEVPA